MTDTLVVTLIFHWLLASPWKKKKEKEIALSNQRDTSLCSVTQINTNKYRVYAGMSVWHLGDYTFKNI